MSLVLLQALVEIGDHIATCLLEYKSEEKITEWRTYVQHQWSTNKELPSLPPSSATSGCLCPSSPQSRLRSSTRCTRKPRERQRSTWQVFTLPSHPHPPLSPSPSPLTLTLPSHPHPPLSPSPSPLTLPSHPPPSPSPLAPLTLTLPSHPPPSPSPLLTLPLSSSPLTLPRPPLSPSHLTLPSHPPLSPSLLTLPSHPPLSPSLLTLPSHLTVGDVYFIHHPQQPAMMPVKKRYLDMAAHASQHNDSKSHRYGFMFHT